VNTAVVVYDLERIRQNPIFQEQIKKEAFGKLANKYHLLGTLGKTNKQLLNKLITVAE
jgi:hypothetical protein